LFLRVIRTGVFGVPQLTSFILAGMQKLPPEAPSTVRQPFQFFIGPLCIPRSFNG
jgi:hypothetical protein